MPPDISPEDEAEGLIDRTPVLEAAGALELAEAEAREAREDAVESERHHHAARAAFGDLVDAAAAGRRVSRKEVLTAHAEAEAAERWASFASAVARKRTLPVEQAQAALADAQHAIWAPVLRRAADHCIAAAALADRARLAGQWGPSTPPDQIGPRQEAQRRATEAARAGFDRMHALLAIAAQGGWRLEFNRTYGPPTWPMTEQFARAYWNRPAEIEEPAHAEA